MDFKTFASHMYPFWILGAVILGLVWAAGQKHLIRIEKPALIRWARFLAIMTVYRYVIYKVIGFHGFGSPESVSFIPWTVTLTVFWEDACHGLPLLILRKLIGVSKWTKPIHFLMLLIVMIEFGLGHVYQGLIPAVLLSFYIPYSIKKGEEFGFGTIMLCHMTYDLITLLSVQYLLK